MSPSYKLNFSPKPIVNRKTYATYSPQPGKKNSDMNDLNTVNIKRMNQFDSIMPKTQPEESKTPTLEKKERSNSSLWDARSHKSTPTERKEL